MCGIFGAIGRWSEGTVRALAVANRERGKDSLGFFDSSGGLIKGAGDPLNVLAKPHIGAWLRGERKKRENHVEKGWFVAGHTRLGTRGAAVRRNAHPFRYGRIVGSHNGMVDAPRDYEVDSMYLFDLLDKHKNDYNKAWGDVSGYWGISWFDGKNFYLQNHDGELGLVNVGDCWYYSSDIDHIKACVQCDHEQILTLAEGQTWCFSPNGESTLVAPFVSSAPQYWTRGNQYSRYICGGNNRYVDSSTRSGSQVPADSNWWDNDEYTAHEDGNVRDFDSEWREAWAQYTTDSEHTKV